MNNMENTALLVCSCDRYESAWYPYFELIKKYWPAHPSQITLVAEDKDYTHPGLNVRCLHDGRNLTWSRRLMLALEKTDRDYVFFSLEDFFLQKPVDQAAIDRCLCAMAADSEIAVFRLCASSLRELRDDGKYPGFRLAGDNVPYRLDTQFALWNRKALMSFIDERESPWEFEGKGTKRILGTGKKFYWYCLEDTGRISTDMIVPYLVGNEYGYGINWGKWLWKNSEMFRENGITADFRALGVLSEKTVKLRMNSIYAQHPRGIYKLIKPCYQAALKAQHGWRVLRRDGMRGVLTLIGKKL